GLLAASPGIPGFDLDSQQSHASVNPAATANTPSAIAFPSRESFKSGGGVPLRLKHLSAHQSKLVHSPLLSKAELLPGPGSLRRSPAYPLSKLGRSRTARATSRIRPSAGRRSCVLSTWMSSKARAARGQQ